MKHLAGAIVLAGAILILAAAIFAGAALLCAESAQDAGRPAITEGVKLAYGSSAVTGLAGAALLGWGIVGGFAAMRRDDLR